MLRGFTAGVRDAASTAPARLQPAAEHARVWQAAPAPCFAAAVPPQTLTRARSRPSPPLAPAPLLPQRALAESPMNICGIPIKQLNLVEDRADYYKHRHTGEPDPARRTGCWWGMGCRRRSRRRCTVLAADRVKYSTA